MRTRTTDARVTNVTGAQVTTTVVKYPTVEDVLGVLARAVAREKISGQPCYVAPSEEVRNALFRFQ